MSEGAGDTVAQPGLTELVGQLAGDAREVARAEVALAKARAFAVVARYRKAAILFATAGTLALAALIALFVGLILMLIPLVGAALATLIVIGGVMIVVAILVLIARASLAEKPAP